MHPANSMQPTAPVQASKSELARSLGLFDSTMLVAGSMIGSGIFIVSAEMSRNVGSPGWLLASWIITGILTLTAALSYGELAAMMPRAGGQYVYLREAFSPLWGFLYGWTLFGVIQTGTIAAVGVGIRALSGRAVAGHLGKPLPDCADSRFERLRAVAFHRAIGGDSGDPVPHLDQHAGDSIRQARAECFHGGQDRLAAGLDRTRHFLRMERAAVAGNFGDFWTPRGFTPIAPGLTPETAFGLLVALCVAQTGSLFSADAWNNITFTAGEVRKPRRNVPLSLAFGTAIVIGLYVLANVAYLVVLPLDKVQTAPLDRVASAMVGAVFPERRRADHGDRHHDLHLRLHQRHGAGGRARLLRHGEDNLFFRPAKKLNKARGSRRGADPAGGMDRASGAAAHLRPGHRQVRKSLQQPAGLRGLRRADLLYPDHRRSLRAALPPPE